MIDSHWWTTNWFDVLQTFAIVAGFFFTGFSFIHESRVRRVDTLIRVNERHSRAWSQLFEKPELKRVLDPRPDLNAQPISIEEQFFTRFLFFNLYAYYQAIRAGMLKRPRGLADDIRGFVRLPIPRQVWGELRPFFDDDFVRYVDSIARSGSGRS